VEEGQIETQGGKGGREGGRVGRVEGVVQAAGEGSEATEAEEEINVANEEIAHTVVTGRGALGVDVEGGREGGGGSARRSLLCRL